MLSGLRFRPAVHPLEERRQPAAYTLTPVVPTIDPAMAARLSAVLQHGAALGNRENVFARAGDSITAASAFLVPLSRPSVGVDQGGDGSLNDTLAYFRSGRVGGADPFARSSTAAVPGFTSANALAWLPTELAATRPGFVLVMVGTNDIAGNVPLETFRQNLAAIVRTALDAGVVPVLSTVPDLIFTAEMEAKQPAYNQAIEDAGEALQVPVWNYWRALQQLPNLGISADKVHPSVSPAGGGDFTDAGLGYGYNVRNLTALQTLDKLRRVVILGQPPDLPNQNAAWAPLTNAVAVAGGDATGFQVQVVDARDRATLFSFDPFPGFRGAVHVALGDVNRDGVPDLVAAPGPGGPPHVKVFDGRTGALLASFYAFEPPLTSGLSVATGDTNGDGAAEVIVAPWAGAAAHVKVFTGGGGLLDSFLAFPAAFAGGARVAAGDVNGDGRADIVVAAGAGGSGHVVVYSGAGLELLASFLPFGGAFGGEVSVAAGDLAGDGRAEIAVSAASPGADPHVVVFRPLTGERVRSFEAYDPGFLGGVQVTTVDRGGGRIELVTASNTAAAADVRVWDANAPGPLNAFFLYEIGFRRGAAFGG